MTARPRVLILKMGSAHPDVVAACGDYEDWFMRALDSHPRRSTFEIVVHPAWDPQPVEAECVLVSGSRHSVYEDLPWLDVATARLDRMIEARKKILGVCFGHQLLARMFGGDVGRNRVGLTMGATTVELTEAGCHDTLYQGLPRRFVVEETHGDVVTRPPPGAPVLVTSSHDHNHAFRLADNVWTVQFHPEMGDREAKAIRAVHENDVRPPLVADNVPRSSVESMRLGTRILHRLVDIALF